MVQELTFAAFSELWLRDYAHVRIKPTGYASYESVIRLHLEPAFGQLRLTSITPEVVASYVASKQRSGLCARTVENHLRLVRSMLRTATVWGFTSANAALSVAPPRVEHADKRFLSAGEMQALILATRPQWRLLVALPCYSGCRKGEALSLRWDCVNLENRTVTIKRSMRRGVVYDVKTPSSRATVPLAAALMPMFEDRRRQCPDPEKGLVFCKVDGSPLSDSKPNQILAAALEAAGLPHVTYHALRRSWCMAQIAAGTPVKTITALGRWTSAQTFLDEYAQYLPVSGGEAVEAIERAIGGAEK